MKINADKKYSLKYLSSKHLYSFFKLISLILLGYIVLKMYLAEANKYLLYMSFAFAVMAIIYHKIAQRYIKTMPILENCYLKYDNEWLDCILPNESGDLYYYYISIDDIEGITEGIDRGTPSFYIKLKNIDRNSSIKKNDTEIDTDVIAVNGIGYSLSDFTNFYNNFCQSLPERVLLLTNKGEKWGRKKLNKLLLLTYALPVVLLAPIMFM